VKAPAHGWPIERLRDALRKDAYKDLGRAEAQKKIVDALAAEKAPVEDVVRDAVARDQALDQYETFARKKYDDRIAARRGRIGQLGDEIQRLQKEAAVLSKEVLADEERWAGWLKKKRAYERDLAWAVGFLLDKPVISTSPDEE
jgi:Asp-tRNA(Asn)/Glu-tRNA(Gln) amidotransferase A subunit family amidase